MDRILLTKAELSDAGFISEISWKDPRLIYRPIKLIQQSIRNGNVFILKDNLIPAGWIETYPITDSVWGIASLYIQPFYRNRKLSKRLLSAAMSHVEQYENLVVTSHPHVQSIIQAHGFKQIAFYQLRVPVLLRLLQSRYSHIKALWKLFLVTGNKLQFFYRV